MTTIQIVDAVHPRDILSTTAAGEAATTGADGTLYASRLLSRSETTESRDGIYNIRSRSAAPSADRQRRTLTLEDGDPGLRKEGDFKQKQVCSCPLCTDYVRRLTGLHREDASLALVPKHRCDLWRHWYQSAVRLLVDVLFCSVTARSYRSTLFDHLESCDDGYCEVCLDYPPCRQRWRRWYFQHIFTAQPIRKSPATHHSSLVHCLQMNITNRDPREASLVQMKRYQSGDLESAGRHMRHRLESSKFARALLKVMGVLAVTMVMSDGLLVR